jgi:NADH dehydrogenase FAD-containing subunit
LERDCTLPRNPEVFVVGDLIARDWLPGLAGVAMQSGPDAASQIPRRLDGDTTPRACHYRDLVTPTLTSSLNRSFRTSTRRDDCHAGSVRDVHG